MHISIVFSEKNGKNPEFLKNERIGKVQKVIEMNNISMGKSRDKRLCGRCLHVVFLMETILDEFFV